MESGWHTARHTPCPHEPTWFSRAPEASLGLWILSGPGGVPEVTLGSEVVLSSIQAQTQGRWKGTEATNPMSMSFVMRRIPSELQNGMC